MKDENKKTEHDKKIVEFDIDETVLGDSDLDRFLRKSMQDAADALEERLNNDPRLQGIDAPEGMFDSIVNELKRQGLWQEDISDHTGNENIHSGFGITGNFFSRDGTNEIDAGSKLKAANGSAYTETGKAGGRIYFENANMRSQADTITGNIYSDVGTINTLANEEKSTLEQDVSEKYQETTCAMLVENDKHSLKLSRGDENDLETCEIKRKKRKRAIRYSGVAAAIMVVFMGFGVTGEANKRMVLKVWDDINNSVLRIAVNPVDGENDLLDQTKKDMEAMAEINKQLGFSIIDFGYYPEGMEYQKYKILNECSGAMVFYNYKNKSIILTMQSSNDGAVGCYAIDSGSKLCGEVKNDQNIVIEIWEVNPHLQDEAYAAKFEYNNCQYVLNGQISFVEMEKIAKGMIIL
ncbi:DUF4367 domain-containing protein [bacterium 1XD42-54]|nr:DUF4367 domain-containing protein [bacterium 1XD42-54]